MAMKRAAFVRLTASSLAACAGGVPHALRAADMPDENRASEEIRAEFLHGWRGYRRAAWGHDEVRPVSGTSHDFFIARRSFGLSIVEALDTLYVMSLDDELHASIEWLRANLDFDVDGEVEVFETIIRMVGGLVAGYEATGERFLLDRARDLADRLLPAFATSPTGAPYRFVNLRTGAVREAHSNLAEIGTNVLEFGVLSHLTGRPAYRDASMRAYSAVISRASTLNLLGTDFDIERGAWIGNVSVAPNPPVDSFYEYLWGGYALFGDDQLHKWYRTLTEAIFARQSEHVAGKLWFRQVDFRTGELAGHRQSELAAFYAGLLAKGGDVAAGRDYFETWRAVAERYGLPPEDIDYADGSVPGAAYELFPEYANSAFDLWRITHDERYRRAAYAHFVAMRASCRVPGGYTIVTDVRTSPKTQGDLTPGYWFAENMKYLYLTFATTPRFDDATGYLSTEGKILRGLRR